MSTINIAIDGPAGAGKSTTAKAVAEVMHIHYLDTGAMYRGIGLFVLRNGILPTDEENVKKALEKAAIRVCYIGNEQHIFLGNEDVTGLIRTPEISKAASDVSAHPCVRLFLTEMQRAVARDYDVVMDGRDIGTNVLKDTPDKFFVTADVSVRAQRRCKELREKGIKTDIKEVEEDMVQRDYNDSHRAFMPLRQAEDAVLIDTTHMTPAQVVERITSAVRERHQ